MTVKGLEGVGTAVVTPFRGDGIDYAALGRLIDWQIAAGVDFLVLLGTTGEAPAVAVTERRKIVGFSVDRVGGRIPLVIGTGANNTGHAVENCCDAGNMGAAVALVVTPYYNKPTQEGLYLHFRTVAEQSPIPVVLYNVPGRTGVNLLPETVARLAEIPTIVGLKEASGNLGQSDEVVRLMRTCRPEFAVFSGNDDQNFHILNGGGRGVISVLSNIAPAQVVRMFRAVVAGDVASARTVHLDLLPLARSLFVETSPAPVKYALSRLGFCENRVRLPLTEASPACMERIDSDMLSCGIALPSSESMAQAS